LAAQMIDGPIAGDAEDPCRQASGGIVATLMAPDLVEDPLQDIFGVVVGHEPAQIAEHRRAVSGIDVVDHAVRTSGQSGFETAVGILLRSHALMRRAVGVAHGGSLLTGAIPALHEQ
jgi:hypothetical protein